MEKDLNKSTRILGILTIKELAATMNIYGFAVTKKNQSKINKAERICMITVCYFSFLQFSKTHVEQKVIKI